jgi:hypothetical protein
MRAAWRSGSWEVTPIAGSRSRRHSGPPAALQRRSRGGRIRRSGSRREREREGAGAGALAQGHCGCCPGPKGRRGPGGGARTEQPSQREQVLEAPVWRQLLSRGAGAQAPKDGGCGGAERSSTTSATTPTAGEEVGGGARTSSEAADSSTTTTADTAAGDTTTTIRAQATDSTTTARSTGGRGHPPEVRGILSREEGPPSRPGLMGVVRLHVSSRLRALRYPS